MEMCTWRNSGGGRFSSDACGTSAPGARRAVGAGPRSPRDGGARLRQNGAGSGGRSGTAEPRMQDVLVDSRGNLHCPYCQGTHFDIAARTEKGKLDGAVSVGVGLLLQMKCLACGEWSKGGDAQLMPPDAPMSANGHPGRQDAGLEWAKREAA